MVHICVNFQKKKDVKFEGDVRNYNEIGKIDDEVIIRVSKEFYRPDNTTVLVGDTTNLKNLGWTMIFIV